MIKLSMRTPEPDDVTAIVSLLDEAFTPSEFESRLVSTLIKNRRTVHQWLLELEDRLEAEIRQRFESDRFQIHIIGFAKMMGDIAAGARGVVLFFGVALLITALLVYAFCRNWKLTLLPLGCSLMGVVWQIGLLNVIGFGLDPMSILVPFLVLELA